MALTALAALALGIGANTALFTVVNAVLLRPLNYPQADRIVELTRSWPGNLNVPAVTPTKFEFWRRENHSFAAMAAYNFAPLGMNLTGREEPERLISLPVTADFFRVLGVRPWMGQEFTESEDKPGAGRFAVISYALWNRVFHRDANAIGKALTLDAANYTVIGVMPAGFKFSERVDLWIPLQLRTDPSDHANDYSVIARLKPGVSLKEAAKDMSEVAIHFRQQFRAEIMMGRNEFIGVHSLHSWMVGKVRPALLVLMAAVGFVLLIVCANVANLLLTRSAMRQNEMAVRTALGATGGRLVRLLLTESLLLSLTGGVLGIVLAEFSLPLLVELAPANLPQADQIGVAISLVLLSGAGLLIQTFERLSNVDPGFDVHRVLVTQMSVSADRFRTTAATASLEERVQRRVETIPGVIAAGTISNLPTEDGFSDPFEVIGRPPSTDIVDANLRVVSPHYFGVMRIRMTAGRGFTERDTQASRRVIIVNEAFARKYFPHENAIGHELLIGRIMGPAFADVPREIVGVVADTHDAGLDAPPEPTYFEPLAQLPDTLMVLANQLLPLNWVIRTAGSPMALAQQIRRETLAASGGVSMAEPRLLEQVVGNSTARQRFSMTLVRLFAGLAVSLCAIGLYGVISYSAAQRTRELSIRAALGAAQSDLLRLVIGQGMWLVGLGLVIGLFAAGALTRFLQDMLFGVTAFDPSVLASVTVMLGVVGLAACWIPARRAAQVDSALALREE